MASTSGPPASSSAKDNMIPISGRKQWRRNPNKRVFVNRSVAMNGIKAIGFDMDYTIAVYKSPAFEQLGFRLMVDRLIEIGYPTEIRTNYEYDTSFVTRGLVFDAELGNMLKIDSNGNILVASHGLKMMRPADIRKCYPNKFIQKDDSSKFYIYNTLFNLPEVYLMSAIIDMFETREGSKVMKKGVMLADDVILTYKQLQKDVRAAVDWVHMRGALKNATVKDHQKYIARDENLPILLDRMLDSGKKLFLATNSEYWYTNSVMTYLFDVPASKGKRWQDFFDVSIVDSRKPLFFEDGTLLRQVDAKTGNLKLGKHAGPLQHGDVYSGGCYMDVTELLNCHGKEIMYIGDHIFGDILKLKKALGWRTFLVIPELADEIATWGEKKDNIQKLAELDDAIGEMFSRLDSASDKRPDITGLQNMIRHVVHDMDMAYGKFGSLFRTGSRNTMFAGQVLRFADLYGSSFINLFFYPFSFLFRAEAQLMPHEVSINQDAARKKANTTNNMQQVTETADEEDNAMTMSQMSMRADTTEEWNQARKTQASQGRHIGVAGMQSPGSLENVSAEFTLCNIGNNNAGSLNGSRPTTPTFITHAFDEDDSDEEEKTEDRTATGAEKDSDDSTQNKRGRRRLDTDNN